MNVIVRRLLLISLALSRVLLRLQIVVRGTFKSCVALGDEHSQGSKLRFDELRERNALRFVLDSSVASARTVNKLLRAAKSILHFYLSEFVYVRLYRCRFSMSMSMR